MTLRRHFSVAAALLVVSAPGFGFAGAKPPSGRVYTATDEVRDIEVAGGRVWAATRGGLAVHDRKDGRFLRKLTSADGLAGTSQRAVLSMGTRGVLTGGDFGLSLVESRDDGPKTTKVIPLAAWQDAYDPIFDLFFAGDGPVAVRLGSGPVALGSKLTLPEPRAEVGGWRAGAWNGTRGLAAALSGALAWFDKAHPALRQAAKLSEPALATAPFGEGFAVATGQSLLLLGGSGLEPVEAPDAQGHRRAVAATALELDEKGGLYVGTASGRIWRLEGQKLELIGEAGHRITAMRADGEVLWLGLAKSGLHRFDIALRALGPSLRPGGEICSNHVTHVAQHRGRIVVGTFDEGACHWDGSGWERLEGLPSPYVLGLASDGQELWVGTSEGLARFDGDFASLSFGPKDPRLLREASKLASGSLVSPEPGRFVFSMTLGVVVAHKTKGGYEVDHHTWREGVPGHRTAIATSDEAIYIGSEYRGVTELTWSGQKARGYMDPVHLPEAWVMDVEKGGKGALWVGTCQTGVSFVEGDKATWYDKKSGLPDDRVIALATWSGGAFVGTLGGLGYVHPSGRARSFETFEWLPDPRVSALAVLGEELWVGTEAGLVVQGLKEFSSVVGG